MDDVRIPAQYWLPKPENVVVCQLCPHHCRIRPGQSGICRARRNLDGQLVAWNYGKVTSMSLDPIEKKPLAFFRSGSRILSIGSFGCNLSCDFCQNWSISQQEAPSRTILPDEMVAMAVQASNQQGNIGLAYTYNEPLVGFEYVLDCSRMIRSAGLCNVLVTNGFVSQEPLAELLPFIDALNIDLKGWDASFYKTVCGGDLETVRRSIEQAAATSHVEVTTLLLPGLNDREEDIEAIARWLASVNPRIVLHLTRHHPDYKQKDIRPISVERLDRLAGLAGKHLTHVRTGNVL